MIFPCDYFVMEQLVALRECSCVLGNKKDDIFCRKLWCSGSGSVNPRTRKIILIGESVVVQTFSSGMGNN